MRCSEYLPMLCRFVDEDLTSTEAERLLQHLSCCTVCQKELDILQSLRSSFQAAGEMEAVPWPGHGFVERAMAMLGQEPPHEQRTHATMNDDRLASPGVSPSWKARITGWIQPGVAFPAWASPFRYVVPILVALLLALWLMPERENKTIDVSSIQPSTDLSGPFVQSDQSFEHYLFHHVTVQPSGDLGDEVPLIQEVTDTGR